MTEYYAEKLSGDRLQRVYEIAGSRVKQYFEAEINHVISRLSPSDHVLELGCGYGRVTARLATAAGRVVGIDNAPENILLARRLDPDMTCEYRQMDAFELTFEDGTFDMVVCIQNGICAFGHDPVKLVGEALRVTGPGGMALFSSYSDRFWPYRLAWFEAQAAEGLLGAIDYHRSINGVIACHDGFESGRMTTDDFYRVCQQAGIPKDRFSITEVDASAVFCEIVRPDP